MNLNRSAYLLAQADPRVAGTLLREFVPPGNREAFLRAFNRRRPLSPMTVRDAARVRLEVELAGRSAEEAYRRVAKADRRDAEAVKKSALRGEVKARRGTKK